jgi:hypothetical protein
LNIRTLNEEEFSNFRSEWNELLVRSTSKSFFLRWEWLFASWRLCTKKDIELHIHVCYAESGDLVGIAPFYGYPAKCLGVSVWYICFLGDEVASDYLDIFTLQGYEYECCEGVLLKLCSDSKKRNTIFQFSDITADSNIYNFFQSSNYKSFCSQKEICPRIKLPTSFEEYFGQRSSSTRYNYRRKSKYLARDFQQFQVVNEYPENTDSLIKNLRMLFDLHKERWEEHKEGSTFHNQFRKEFNHKMFESLGDRESVLFSKLYICSKLVSMLYIFRQTDHYFFYQNGWLPEYKGYSIGIVHLIRAIECVIKNGGITFDFLRGPEDYKFKLNNDIRYTYSIYFMNHKPVPSFLVLVMLGKVRIMSLLRMTLKRMLKVKAMLVVHLDFRPNVC